MTQHQETEQICVDTPGTIVSVVAGSGVALLGLMLGPVLCETLFKRPLAIDTNHRNRNSSGILQSKQYPC